MNNKLAEALEFMDSFIDEHQKKEVMNRCVIRVSSSTYLTKRGLEYKRTATILKSKGNLRFCDFACDIAECPPINFHDVPDGLYELGTTNISKDWETGFIDDWDVVLEPYSEALENE